MQSPAGRVARMTDLQPHRRNPQPAASLTARTRLIRGFTRVGSVAALLLAFSGTALSISFPVERYDCASDASAGASVLGCGPFFRCLRGRCRLFRLLGEWLPVRRLNAGCLDVWPPQLWGNCDNLSNVDGFVRDVARTFIPMAADLFFLMFDISAN